MPEYDAFGREIGEDPLKSLREESPRVEVSARPPERSARPPEPSARAPEPFARPPEVDEEDVAAWSGPREPEPEPDAERIVVPPRQFVRPRRRRRGGLAGLIVIVAVVGAAALAANSAVEEGKDLIDRAIPALPDAETEAAPVGLGARSLVRADNFAAALSTLAASGLGRPTWLRVAPARIDAQLLKGGELHSVQITPDGELHEFASSQGSGRPMAFTAIDRAAPERLVRRGATRKSPARTIDYLVISPGPPPTVGAYFKSGRIVIGDAHGRLQRVL